MSSLDGNGITQKKLVVLKCGICYYENDGVNWRAWGWSFENWEEISRGCVKIEEMK